MVFLGSDQPDDPRAHPQIPILSFDLRRVCEPLSDYLPGLRDGATVPARWSTSGERRGERVLA
jgi:hypothetical protein